jgi:hypothetical protein
MRAGAAQGGTIIGEVTIEGHAAVNPAGRAVVIQTRAGCWIVPLVSSGASPAGRPSLHPSFPLSGWVSMSEEIRRAVALLADGVIEVRVLADGATHSGYFDDHTLLALAVEALDADPSVAGIYVTLNDVNPALLARRANRIKMRLSRKDATTADADILRRRWFPVDIDPVRPSGVSSTDAEHDAALAAAERIAIWLVEQGFPARPGRLRATAPTSSTGWTSPTTQKRRSSSKAAFRPSTPSSRTMP